MYKSNSSNKVVVQSCHQFLLVICHFMLTQAVQCCYGRFLGWKSALILGRGNICNEYSSVLGKQRLPGTGNEEFYPALLCGESDTKQTLPIPGVANSLILQWVKRNLNLREKNPFFLPPCTFITVLKFMCLQENREITIDLKSGLK